MRAPSAAGALPPGQVVAAKTIAEAPAAPGGPGYRIGGRDVLEITVYNVQELNRTVQVSENGSISFPLIGETMAAGMTAQELERDMAKRLGDKYLQRPQVSVSIKEFNSQQVTIEGAVKKPGVYPLRSKTTLIQLLAVTEGMTENAESEVAIVRFVRGKRVAAKFDVDEVRSGKVEDPALLAGDVVIVGTSAMKSAFNNVLRAVPLASAFRPF